MKEVIVTGANGFVGQHLVKELAENGINVVGVGGINEGNHRSPYMKSYVGLDLSKPKAASNLDFMGIDAVVHLAGLAAVGPSFDSPMLYLNVNLGIEVNLFETALKQGVKPRFLIISSGTLYDAQNSSLPITETSAVEPSSPYAVSKLGQEQLASYYRKRGFDYVIARPFNHAGPGQNLGFIVPDLAKQIVDFEKGATKQILVGNLDAQRDYTDVRDIVRAYRLLLDKGKAGEIYNVCSGSALSGHDILTSLMEVSGQKPEIVEDPIKMRPADTPILYGSYQKLKDDTGWKPEISLDITFRDVLEDWRQRT